jgi:hypothetical protein
MALGMAGLLLTLFAALQMAQLLAALVGLAVLVAPTYLVAWSVLRPRLGVASAFVVAGGLSVGLIVLTGLLLNVTPWGLLQPSWLAVGIAALVIAVGTRRRAMMTWHPSFPFAAAELSMVAIGISLSFAALFVARMADSQPAESFTQLSVISVATAPNPSVQLTVRSEERKSTSYRLDLLRDGVKVRSWTDIALASGEAWSATAPVAPGRIEARLFLAGDTTSVYRHVTIVIGGSGGAAAANGQS